MAEVNYATMTLEEMDAAIAAQQQAVPVNQITAPVDYASMSLSEMDATIAAQEPEKLPITDPGFIRQEVGDAVGGYMSNWGDNIKEAAGEFRSPDATQEMLKYGQLGGMAGLAESAVEIPWNLIIAPLAAQIERKKDDFLNTFAHDDNDPNNRYRSLKEGRDQIAQVIEQMQGVGADTTMMEQNLARMEADLATAKETYDEYYVTPEVENLDSYKEKYIIEPKTEFGKNIQGLLGALVTPVESLREGGGEALGENFGDSPHDRERIEQNFGGAFDVALGLAPIKAPLTRGRAGQIKTRNAAQAEAKAVRVEEAAAAKDLKPRKKVDERIAENDAIIKDLDAQIEAARTQHGEGTMEFAQKADSLTAQKAEISALQEPLAKARETINDAAIDQAHRRSNPEYKAAMEAAEAATTAEGRAVKWRLARKILTPVARWLGRLTAEATVPGSGKFVAMAEATAGLIKKNDATYGSGAVKSPTATTFTPTARTKSPVPETQVDATPVMEPIRQPMQPETTVTVEPQVEGPAAPSAAAQLRKDLKKQEVEQQIQDRRTGDDKLNLDFDAEVNYKASEMETWIREAQEHQAKLYKPDGKGGFVKKPRNEIDRQAVLAETPEVSNKWTPEQLEQGRKSRAENKRLKEVNEARQAEFEKLDPEVQKAELKKGKEELMNRLNLVRNRDATSGRFKPGKPKPDVTEVIAKDIPVNPNTGKPVLKEPKAEKPKNYDEVVEADLQKTQDAINRAKELGITSKEHKTIFSEIMKDNIKTEYDASKWTRSWEPDAKPVGGKLHVVEILRDIQRDLKDASSAIEPAATNLTKAKVATELGISGAEAAALVKLAKEIK
jgi:hypothetical protein